MVIEGKFIAEILDREKDETQVWKLVISNNSKIQDLSFPCSEINNDINFIAFIIIYDLPAILTRYCAKCNLRSQRIIPEYQLVDNFPITTTME